jgi:hypothetical protein
MDGWMGMYREMEGKKEGRKEGRDLTLLKNLHLLIEPHRMLRTEV